jgi:hypothetical protein
MAIETKFQIGDVVHFATTVEEVGQLPCPDCRDTRKWQAISPGGRGYTFACPRCSNRYASHHELSLRFNEHKPCARRLTIGSIRYDSSDAECPVSYMCVETGVGSGSIFPERRLFTLEADAIAHASAMAQVCNQRAAKNGHLYHGNLEVCDYQLDLALVRVRDATISDLKWSIDDLCNDFADALVEGEDAVATVTTWLSKQGRSIEEANPAVKFVRRAAVTP